MRLPALFGKARFGASLFGETTPPVTADVSSSANLALAERADAASTAALIVGWSADASNTVTLTRQPGLSAATSTAVTVVAVADVPSTASLTVPIVTVDVASVAGSLVAYLHFDSGGRANLALRQQTGGAASAANLALIAQGEVQTTVTVTVPPRQGVLSSANLAFVPFLSATSSTALTRTLLAAVAAAASLSQGVLADVGSTANFGGYTTCRVLGRVVDLTGQPLGGIVLQVTPDRPLNNAVQDQIGAAVLFRPLSAITAIDGTFFVDLITGASFAALGLPYRVRGPGIAVRFQVPATAYATVLGSSDTPPVFIDYGTVTRSGRLADLAGQARQQLWLRLSHRPAESLTLADGTLVSFNPVVLDCAADGSYAVTTLVAGAFSLPGIRLEVVAGASFRVSVPLQPLQDGHIAL